MVADKVSAYLSSLLPIYFACVGHNSNRRADSGLVSPTTPSALTYLLALIDARGNDNFVCSVEDAVDTILHSGDDAPVPLRDVFHSLLEWTKAAENFYWSNRPKVQLNSKPRH